MTPRAGPADPAWPYCSSSPGTGFNATPALHRQPDHLVERQLESFIPDLLRSRSELRFCGADVAIQQRVPEADVNIRTDLCEFGRDARHEPERGLGLPQTRERHGRALHLEPHLDMIIKDA